MKIAQGWLSAGTQLVSPNTDQRPDQADISLLVVHNISLPPEQFGGPYIGQLFSAIICRTISTPLISSP